MSTKKRKSKWDEPAGDQVTANKATSEGNGQSGSLIAAEAAARINAMLAAKGRISNQPTQAVSSTSLSVASVFKPSVSDPVHQKLALTEVNINDSPARTELLKTSTLADINRKSGAILAVKGRYLSPGEKEEAVKRGEKPLHIHIQAAVQSNVDMAVKCIEDIKTKAQVGLLNLNQPQLPSGQHYIQHKVFIGLEQIPENFNLKDKLQGPANSFFDHIMKQTGAKVHLRGRGSGYLEPTSGRESFETLYIYLQHGTQEGLQKAVKLCEDLVKHVKEDYEKLKCQPTSFYQPSSSSLPYHTGMILPSGPSYGYQQTIPPASLYPPPPLLSQPGQHPPQFPPRFPGPFPPGQPPQGPSPNNYFSGGPSGYVYSSEGAHQNRMTLLASSQAPQPVDVPTTSTASTAPEQQTTASDMDDLKSTTNELRSDKSPSVVKRKFTEKFTDVEAKKQTETSMEKIPHRTDHHEEGVGEEQGEREGTHPKVPAITDLMPPPRFIPPIVTGVKRPILSIPEDKDSAYSKKSKTMLVSYNSGSDSDESDT